jgi:pheromone shutdown protein TraB
LVRENKEVLTINGEETNDLSLLQTYLSIIKLLKKKCIRQVILISLLSPIGSVAITHMTHLALIG